MSASVTIEPKGAIAVGGGKERNVDPALAGLVTQYQSSQDTTEKISDQINKLSREILRLQMQRKKTEADLEELASLSNKDAKTYKQIARAFVARPPDVLKSDVLKDQSEIDDDIVKLTKVHKAMADKLSCANAQMSELQKQLISASQELKT
eukprot:GHVS01016399.1.p1 GENE.GHVS01016399.1~~GHVS01016399.1.p1  ORF type:complete len:151 (-),score=31.40 GHVS01016399.1:176-628(-)